ncbi:DNA cytosine methyltransferase [Pseudanabaena mucicola]|uniref:Cytosine-specific methyltransferase n=1 Tax=Pseudanabaena mucicola FACHB-723 TaxID=2692860 RepID=A0ABR7ZWH5_9CYAN|nr:DNA (cytosine-5-)-methyltransferase [Pseudanabaena mucicola]MBD2188125.1 DNA (cytosine-5-)-methyltransferase [Pseudanabaena mucicola FACHB-723]
MKKLRIVSLFSGCGGSDLGLLGGFSFLGEHYKRLRTSIVLANDIDVFAADTYKANFKHNFICKSITDISSIEIPEHDVLVGGFPCQAFSIIGQRKGLNDTRGQLFLEMGRILKDKQPLAFIAENVKGLTNIQKGKIFETILKEFEQSGYNIFYKILNAANYGIPQKRERVFIVGFRKDLKVEFVFPTSSDKLIPLKLVLQDDYDKRFIFSERAVQGLKNSNKAFNKGRIQDIEKPCNTINSHLAKISLNGTDPVLLVNLEKEIYRRFTPLEAARIQSFPDNFIFPVSEFQTYKQIGNAIPPVLMWHLFQEVLSSIDNAVSTSTITKSYNSHFHIMPVLASTR